MDHSVHPKLPVVAELISALNQTSVVERRDTTVISVTQLNDDFGGIFFDDDMSAYLKRLAQKDNLSGHGIDVPCKFLSLTGRIFVELLKSLDSSDSDADMEMSKKWSYWSQNNSPYDEQAAASPSANNQSSAQRGCSADASVDQQLRQIQDTLKYLLEILQGNVEGSGVQGNTVRLVPRIVQTAIDIYGRMDFLPKLKQIYEDIMARRVSITLSLGGVLLFGVALGVIVFGIFQVIPWLLELDFF